MLSALAMGFVLSSALWGVDDGVAAGSRGADICRNRERDGRTTNAFRPPGLSRFPSVAKALVINSDNATNGFGYLVMVCSSSMAENARLYGVAMVPGRPKTPMPGRPYLALYRARIDLSLVRPSQIPVQP